MAVSSSARSASRKERGFYWNLNKGSDNFEEKYEEDISLTLSRTGLKLIN